MAGIGIILNPHSKKHKIDPDRMKRMSFIVGDKGSCKETSDLGDLRRVAEEFKTRGVEILGIGGGDGTNHVVLTTLIKVYGEKPLPKITFLRGGTLNTLAEASGIKGSPEKILSNLIYKYHEDQEFKIKEIDIMEINGEYGFIFGTGVIVRFMKAYYEGIPSPPRAAWTLTHSIASAIVNGPFARKMFDRYDAEVKVDGAPWAFKNYSALYAGSVDRLGLNFRVFYHSETPSKFHAIGFSLPPRNVLRHVPNMFLGKPSTSEDILQQAAEEMTMRFNEPQEYTIDGDIMPATTEITVKTGPRLKVVVG
ncbi:MAG: diacylglycerol kinase family protein [bacterium]